MSERITENLVRDGLLSLGYNAQDNGVTIELQKSEIAKVKSLLSKASKNDKGNSGYPEFIISNLKDPNFLIVFECKPDVRKHESANRDKAVEYAVDGVLHYAKHLSKHYTVLAVAVSGTTENTLKISNFLHPAGAVSPKPLVNEAGLDVDKIIPFDDYYRLAAFDPDVAKKRHSDLLAFSRELHELIWTKAKIPEEDKPLLVSGTLIALMNASFMKTFASLPAEDMQEAWLGAIKKEFDKADILQGKKNTMLQPYSNIASYPNLARPDTRLAKEYPDGVFKEIISRINNNLISHEVQQAHPVSLPGCNMGASILKEMRHGNQQGSVSKGTFDCCVHGSVRNRGAMPRGAGGLALGDGICLPELRLRAALHVLAQGAAILAVRGLPGANHGHLRNGISGHQVAAYVLVLGHAPAHPGQEQRLGPGTQAPPGRAIQDGLADEAQAAAGHV